MRHVNGRCLRRGRSELRERVTPPAPPAMPSPSGRAEQTASYAASPAARAACVVAVEGARAGVHAKPGLHLRHRPTPASPRADGRREGTLADTACSSRLDHTLGAVPSPRALASLGAYVRHATHVGRTCRPTARTERGRACRRSQLLLAVSRRRGWRLCWRPQRPRQSPSPSQPARCAPGRYQILPGAPARPHPWETSRPTRTERRTYIGNSQNPHRNRRAYIESTTYSART